MSDDFATIAYSPTEIYLSTAAGSIYVVDLAAATYRQITQTPLALTDIALDPDGRLFGVTATALYQIDPVTGNYRKAGDLRPTEGEVYFGYPALTDAIGLDISPSGVARVTDGRAALVLFVDLATGAVRNENLPFNHYYSSPWGDLWFDSDDSYLLATGNRMVLFAGEAEVHVRGWFHVRGPDAIVASPPGARFTEPNSILAFIGKTMFERLHLENPETEQSFYSVNTGTLEQEGVATLLLDGDITGAAARKFRAGGDEALQDGNAPPEVTVIYPQPAYDILDRIPLSSLVNVFDPDGPEDIYYVAGEVIEGGTLLYNASSYYQDFAVPLVELDRFSVRPDGSSDTLTIELLAVDSYQQEARIDITLNVETLYPDSLVMEYFARQTAYARGGLGDAGNIGAKGEVYEGWRVAEVFKSGTFRAVALEKPGYHPVLAFRGTEGNVFDWLVNSSPTAVGFNEINAASSSVITDLIDYIEANPQVSLTGHSQGGAQAQIFAENAVRLGLSTIGKLYTFNAPGIYSHNSDPIDPGILEVRHWVSAGDIVSMAGLQFVTGDVVYYDLDSIGGPAEAGELLKRAHTAHWAQDALYTWGAGDTATSAVYAPQPVRYSQVITSTAELNAPTFSHVTADPGFDNEFEMWLDSIEIGALLGFPDVDTESYWLLTRESVENLRQGAGKGLSGYAAWIDLISGAPPGSAASEINQLAYNVYIFFAAFGDKQSAAQQDRGLEISKQAFHTGASPAFIQASAATGDTLGSRAAPIFVLLGPDSESVELPPAANTVAGTGPDLNGTVISDFDGNDALILLGDDLFPEQVSITEGSAIIALDTDGDGTGDSVVTLLGDYDLDQFTVTAKGSNTVISYGATRQVAGDPGNDRLQLPLDKVVVEAGAGVDTLVAPLFVTEYALREESPGVYVGNVAGWSLELQDVEFLEFGSQFVTTVPIEDIVSGYAQERVAKLSDLYISFFGRAPDVVGLEFWVEQILEKGRSFADISGDFAASLEAQTLYPADGSNRDFVRNVYLNAFGREPDAGGWDFWTGLLDSLGDTALAGRGEFVGQLILGAYSPTSGAADRNLLENRHEVALHYVNKLVEEPSEGFDNAINDLLALVTDVDATQASALGIINHVFDDPVTLAGALADTSFVDTLFA